MIQQSHTNVDLRGIHNVGGGVAWASGAQGTILRTTDGGKTWQHCSVPPRAEKLDFKGIQAFDESTAIVMSSGPGTQSQIYKTTDGCLTWKLLFTNPDAPKGSFNTIQFIPGTGRDKGRVGDLIGDPVAGHFATFRTYDYGKSWSKSAGLWSTSAKRGEVLIAASNSSLLEVRGWTLFVTGGALSRSRTLEEHVRHDPSITVTHVGGDIPLRHGEWAGAASVAARLGPDSVANLDAAKYIVRAVHVGDMLVAVGGDYRQPDLSDGTCAVSTDGSLHWSASQTPPRGYRSSVAYDAASNTWITVGPNGTDISTDDGRNWRPLKPSSGEPADADKYWNALSLPFAVGPDGRIGKLRENALKP
jgi:photosystem II stability/assembly factor-like uncharacterized protein